MSPQIQPPPKPALEAQIKRRHRWKLLIARPETIPWSFQSTSLGLDSRICTALTALATFLILALLAVILGNILWQGAPGLSFRFVLSGTEKDMFDVSKAGVLPMIIGTAARVILMTIFVIPIGVITARYFPFSASRIINWVSPS